MSALNTHDPDMAYILSQISHGVPIVVVHGGKAEVTGFPELFFKIQRVQA